LEEKRARSPVPPSGGTKGRITQEGKSVGEKGRQAFRAGKKGIHLSGEEKRIASRGGKW